jgi:hypothetical protein
VSSRTATLRRTLELEEGNLTPQQEEATNLLQLRHSSQVAHHQHSDNTTHPIQALHTECEQSREKGRVEGVAREVGEAMEI